MIGVVVIVVVIVLAFLVLILLALLNGILFYPVQEHIWEPPHNYQALKIDNRISAWHFNNHSGSKTVLFCHGNAGNISHRDYVIELCHRHQLNLLIFDYSGFGQSSGYPSQRQICRDGETAYAYLLAQPFRQADGTTRPMTPDDLIIWGESLGGAVAAYVASRHPCSRLILMSTFSSLDDIVWHQETGIFARAMVYILSKITDMLSTKYRISSIKCPIAIVHSTQDDLIPYTNAISLYNAISHDYKILIPIQGGHSTPDISPEQLKELLSFCHLQNLPGTRSEGEGIGEILEMIRTIKDKHCCRKRRYKVHKSFGFDTMR
jgi:pimeloyl-ACP methyl ester carboxylesterase